MARIVLALFATSLALLVATLLFGAAPAKEVTVQPGDNVQSLVDRNPEGTTFRFKPGLYRMVSIVPKDRDVFVAEKGVVLNGSQLLRFEKRGEFWVAKGQTNPDEEEIMRRGQHVGPEGNPRQGGGGGPRGGGPGRGGFGGPGGGPRAGGRRPPNMEGPRQGGGGNQQQMGGPAQKEYRGRCQPEFPNCIFPEDVFLDSKPLVRVSSREELKPGVWYSDSSAGEIYLADNPNGHTVELSLTRTAFSGSARDVVIRGFTIEKYGQPAGEAAIDGKDGERWTVEKNELRLNHSSGIRSNNNWKILNNNTHHNGEAGMGGTGRDILVEGNEMAYNNYAGYWPGWESGGAKFVRTENLVVRNNYSHHNVGPGLWTDISNSNTLYEGNRTTANTEGIFHEISFKAIIRNNTIWDDGMNNYGHHEADAGILIGESQDVEVYGNTITNCRNGILGRQLNRRTDQERYRSERPYEIKNLDVHDNVITQSSGIAMGIIKPGRMISDEIYKSWGNRFQNNTVKLTDPNGKYFAWDDERYSEPEWKKIMRSSR